MNFKSILKSDKFWLWLIFILGAFLRFYRLGQVPSGFVNDEADGMANKLGSDLGS